jgi:hypothetical protein
MRLRRRPNGGPPVALRLRVPGALRTGLTAYAYQHGEPIEVSDLVIEIVRTFVSGDREFRGRQRRRPGPATRETGTNRRRAAMRSPAALPGS